MPDLVPGRLGRPVNRWDEKIIGGVMLWVSVGAFALLLWLADGMVSLGRTPDLFASCVLAALATIGLFFAVVGWRVFWNQPNRYGSLLGPIGWRILGVLFGVLAWFVIGLIMARRDLWTDARFLALVLASLTFTCAFSYSCFRVAQTISKRVPHRTRVTPPLEVRPPAPVLICSRCHQAISFNDTACPHCGLRFNVNA